MRTHTLAQYLKTTRASSHALLSALLVGFGSLLALATPAKADTLVGGVVYDQTGIPRCIPSRNGKDALVFLWETDEFYRKDIRAAAMSQMQFFVQNADSYPYSCANWRTYIDGVSKTGGYLSADWIVKPGDGARGFQSGGSTFLWDSAAESRLSLLRNGANVAHPGANAAEFLALNPVSEYTREYNRQTTAAYGIGFAADIYKEWLMNQPGNRDFLSNIEIEIRRTKTQGTRDLKAKLKQYKILIAQGYMQSPTLNRLEPLIRYLSSLGADVSVMNSDTVGPIVDNSRSFKSQISRELSNGRQLILISASKGAPEILNAIGELASENPRSIAQIKAVITMAGMIQGSFLVDWADRFPISLFVKDALKSGAESAKLNVTSTVGFFDMSTDSLARQSQNYRKSLPNLRYYNFVGVLTGDGLAKDKDIRMLQDKISMPHVGAHGANDGYIEYPGTRFPRSWGYRSRDVVFDSSHAILDGAFNGHPMESQRDLVIGGIFSAVLNDAARD